MESPGEKLLIKMWKTLAEKGVGGLLKPWQIRRIGKAQTDVKTDEIVALAQAKAQVDRISCAIQNQPPASPQLSSSPELQTEPQQPSHPYFDADLISDIVAKKDHSLSIQREINVSKAVLIAEDVLSQSEADLVSESISEDWLHRWEEYAGQVSADELQELWGRILAGEVINPGSNSLRLLEFLKVISKPEAKLIEILGPLDFHGLIILGLDEYLDSKGLSFRNLLLLQDLGIVSSVNSSGIFVNYTSSISPPDADTFLRTFLFGEKAMVTKHINVDEVLKISAYGITTLGKQVLSLGSFEPDYDYLLLLAKKIASMGFVVEVGDWEDAGESYVTLTNSSLVTA